MKDIDIRWVENVKTKSSSLTLIDREPWNDYPENTATVELLGVRKRFPEAKISFIFPKKVDTYNEYNYSTKLSVSNSINWSVRIQVNMTYNTTNKDYDIYINFPSGKYNSPLLNFQEFDIFYRTINQIKSDLNNILTVNNFSK
jgi:hypothetical protein